MKKQQAGFTLIELVLVIVILGILAATAVPRFSDLSGNARQASILGLNAGLRSAAAIAKATSLAQGLASSGAGSTVTLEGQPVTMSGSYPTANTAGIDKALSDFSGFTSDGAGTFTLRTSCTVTYANAGIGAVTITSVQTGC